jgi:hypothetical protein
VVSYKNTTTSAYRPLLLRKGGGERKKTKIDSVRKIAYTYKKSKPHKTP